MAEMPIKDLIAMIDLRYQSGNSIQADRAFVRTEEWKRIRDALAPSSPSAEDYEKAIAWLIQREMDGYCVGLTDVMEKAKDIASQRAQAEGWT